MSEDLKEVRGRVTQTLEEECSRCGRKPVQSSEPGVFQGEQEAAGPGWGVRGEGSGVRNRWRGATKNLTG